MNLSHIQEREVRDSTHYFPDHHAGFEYLAIALAGEVGETCNDIKKWSRGDFDTDELQYRLFRELPDILIYLVMLSGALGIDLEEAYDHKKEYNDRRYGTSGS